MLDTRAIESAVYPYLGPDKTLDDIEGARAALEKAYATAGYQTVYVTIPKQTVHDGIVELKAVEAKIGTIAIKGNKWVPDHEVSAALPSLQAGSVPNVKNLNSDLTALNSQSADLQVTPQLKPGAKPETIDVDLDVADKLALHGGIEMNNRYSRNTHQYRLQANAEYDNLWGLNHSLSGVYDVAPQDPADSEIFSATYTAPVPGTDIKLSLTGLRSNSDVGALGSTDVLGKGWSASLAAEAPLGMIGSYFQYVQASVSYKRFTDIVTLGSGSSSTVNTAPITYYPVSLSYNGSLREGANDLSFSLSANFAFRHLGSNSPSFDYARHGADGNFFYLKGDFDYLRHLPYGFDVYLEGAGQFASEPLISNEEFSVGGDGSVRGYLQSEGIGDKGMQGTLELRSPSLAPYLGKGTSSWLNDLRLVGFMDAGGAWVQDALKGQQNFYSLRSAGAGTTLQLLDHFNGSLYWAYPLKSTGASTDTHYGQSRLQFRVWTQF